VSDPRQFAAKVSLGAALVILAVKAVAWRLSGSVALQADALESTVNVATGLMLLFAVRWAAQPPDEGHPWGHGKAEYLSAGVEGTLVAVAGLGILGQAVQRLLAPTPPTALELGAALSVAAAVANGLLGTWLLRRGRALGSPALQADGRHALVDVVTTVGSLAGFAAAVLFDRPWLDPVAALLVGLHVLREASHVLGDAVQGLMDAALPDDERQALRRTIEGALGPEAIEFHDLRARRTAGALHLELHLVVPGDLSVDRAHALCDAVEQAIEEAHGPTHANLHVEPEHEARGSGADYSSTSKTR
jgi:cation diffusion facilitator family transporter